MPRQPRLVLPHVALHIVQRGNNRNDCFRIESDYLVYLLHIGELAQKLGCLIHAYCLMTNHVHLLLTPCSTNACIALMRNLGQRYVQYFNKRHQRTGTLWEGRFRSCVTESARYVLACYRYIEMNPVRAGIVKTPDGYRWSSHRGNTGRCEDRLLSPHPEFLALGDREAERRTGYKALFERDVETGMLAAIRKSTNGGYPLGIGDWKASIAPGRRLTPGKAGRPAKAHADNEAANQKSGSDPDLLFSGDEAS